MFWVGLILGGLGGAAMMSLFVLWLLNRDIDMHGGD